VTIASHVQIPDLDVLLQTYEGIREGDHRSPLQHLQSLNQQLTTTILPRLVQIGRQSASLKNTFDDTATSVLDFNIRVASAASESAKRLAALAEDALREKEEILRQLDQLPADSPERQSLLRSLDVRTTIVDYLGGKIAVLQEGVGTLSHQIQRMGPSLIGLRQQIRRLEHRYRRTELLIRLWSVSHGVVYVLPTAIALITTLVFDRATPFAESFASPWLPNKYHDLVLLIFFAIQVPVLTPFVSRFTDNLYWKNLDRTLRMLRPLVQDLKSVESVIQNAEQGILAIKQAAAR
jgi:hypothetical protein